MRSIFNQITLVTILTLTYNSVSGSTTRLITSIADVYRSTESEIWYNGSLWKCKKGSKSTNIGTIIAISETNYYERSFTGPIHIEWFNAVDASGFINSKALKQAIEAASMAKERLSFGPGTYKFDQPIYLESNLTVEGAGQEQTIFVPTANFSENRLIVGNGCSNIVLKDFTITGLNKEMDAGIRLNSFPNKCFNILINQLYLLIF